MTELLSSTNYSKDLWYRNNWKLYSYTKKIDACDPKAFYQFEENLYKGERFYWKTSDNDMKIIGLGIATSILSFNEGNRYEDIQEKWNTVINDAKIINNSQSPGTGPLIFGGFCFDSESIKESEWEPFGDSLFYLPKYMMTVINDKDYYLTVNYIHDNCSDEELMKETDDILYKLQNAKNYVQYEKVPSIKSSKELAVHEWVQAVERIVQMINSSEQQKVVLARKMKVEFENNISSTYVLQQLLHQQPSSFVFSIENGESCFIGASPERLVKKINDHILSTCLAGSIGRSTNLDEDKRLGEALLHDPKNLFEHELVVSMIEDALRQFCHQLTIPEQPILMKTPDVQHLYTPVVGKTWRNSSILEMVQELHPTPALGGVPTKPAMELIRENENMDRGFYASPIGWTDYLGNGEFIVGIRSGLLKGKESYLYAGCGLVSDSKSNDELIETRIKFRPMLKAIGGKL
ncbi:MAG TPA: isochorismate synthase [Bacillaceae bacterium]|nr:isochorismate synthase [Bacillaceae bacterium]